MTSTSTPALAACPFCNGALEYRPMRDGEDWLVHPQNDCILARLDGIGDPVYILDNEEDIAAWNRRAESEEVAALRKELDAEQAAVRHWKANHDQMVARKALLEQRPDLPVDRIPAMREMKRLQTENAALRSTLREVREALQFANDSPNGPIGDTIWMMHRPETLFDFIDAALANPPEQSK